MLHKFSLIWALQLWEAKAGSLRSRSNRRAVVRTCGLSFPIYSPAQATAPSAVSRDLTHGLSFSSTFPVSGPGQSGSLAAQVGPSSAESRAHRATDNHVSGGNVADSKQAIGSLDKSVHESSSHIEEKHREPSGRSLRR